VKLPELWQNLFLFASNHGQAFAELDAMLPTLEGNNLANSHPAHLMQPDAQSYGAAKAGSTAELSQAVHDSMGGKNRAGPAEEEPE